jgi:hypothetical protein
MTESKFHLAVMTGKRRSLPKRCLDPASCTRNSTGEMCLDQGSSQALSLGSRVTLSKSGNNSRIQFLYCKKKRAVRPFPDVLSRLVFNNPFPSPPSTALPTSHSSYQVLVFYVMQGFSHICLIKQWFISLQIKCKLGSLGDEMQQVMNFNFQLV